MLVFVTGATGYIGGVVAERLTQQGYRVLGLARTQEAADRLLARKIIPALGDLDEPAGLTRFCREADAVIHTAFQWGDNISSSIQAESVVIRSLLDGVRGTGKKLVFTSGTSVLGDTGSSIYTEETPIEQHGLNERLRNEQLVLQAKDVHGIVIRPPNVYGRSGGQALFASLRKAGHKYKAVPYTQGTGDHLWSFVHVEDLAELFVLALESAEAHQLFHAGAESGLHTASIAAALSNNVGWNGQTIELSLSEMKSLFPVPALAEYWARNSQSSKAKAELLGWKPRHMGMLEWLSREVRADGTIKNRL